MKYYLPRLLFLEMTMPARPHGAGTRKLLDTLFRLSCRFQRIRKNPFCEPHHRTRSVYVHVPKTGGNSVTRMLYGVPSNRIGGHKAAWEYQAHSPEWFARYFVFATVRHPLTKLNSALRYLKSGGMNARDAAFARRHLADVDSLSDLLRAMEDGKRRHSLMRWVHFIPHSYFLCDANGTMLVENLVRMERFDEDMRLVCERLGLPFAPQRANVTPGENRTVFDRDTAEACRALYRRDYEILGYDLLPP